ncbi:MAG: NAD-dependent epimerase/dehydratase family protein [Bacteroidetes bacterium]|nr:NAD-dependent epimerase/dehydratase family protein [Bacteroidota bacterium]
MGKIAFVTGGTGFVGSHLVEALLQHGYSEIRCLIRSEPKWLSNLNVSHVYGTLDDPVALKRALKGVEYIYHLGALTRAKTWSMLYNANVEATTNLMRAAADANVSKICVASSLAVVGKSSELIADESTPCQPVSMYGWSKLAMENELNQSSLPIIILRPPAVYGPRDRDLLTFFSAVNRGICVTPRRDHGLSLVYVKDLARGIIQAAESPHTVGKTYYLGNHKVISWGALKRASENALNKKSRMVHVPRSLILPLGSISEFTGKISGNYPPLNREKAREILHATKQCSSRKAQEEFGYTSHTSLEEGIQETITWYRKHRWL